MVRYLGERPLSRRSGSSREWIIAVPDQLPLQLIYGGKVLKDDKASLQSLLRLVSTPFTSGAVALCFPSAWEFASSEQMRPP